MSSRSEKSRRSWYRDLGIREFGGPEDEGLDTRHQKFSNLRKDQSRPSAEGCVSRDHPLRRLGHRDSQR
jgi:hypothetical protein